MSRTVDGISDSANISKLFADKYRKIYTCVPYNEHDIQSIVEEVGNVVNMEAYGTHYLTSLSDVKSAIHRMKPHKKEGCVGLPSDHFINAGDDLCCHIAFLFTAILAHGSLPVRVCDSCTARLFQYQKIVMLIHRIVLTIVKLL